MLTQRTSHQNFISKLLKYIPIQYQYRNARNIFIDDTYEDDTSEFTDDTSQYSCIKVFNSNKKFTKLFI